MTIIGSYKDDNAFSKTRISLMCRETASDSLEKLQENVRHFTPKGKTGRLWDSVSKKGPHKVSSNVWEGEVFSSLHYASSIEYGWAGRVITPKNPNGWLKWYEGPDPVFAKKTVTSYMPGAHMFLKGKNMFEHGFAEEIAQRNARKWLGAVDAGRKTVVF